MIKISNVRVPLGEKRYAKIISNNLNIREKDIRNVILLRKSLDARRKNIHYICSFAFETDHEDYIVKKHHLSYYTPYVYELLPYIKDKVLIVGSGPAGLFAAYILSLSHVDVTIVERGKRVEERIKDIDELMNKGTLNPESNILFGEGGAGTFSDGKLTATSKNRCVELVLKTFVKYGASEDILYNSKPHIGTDVLRKIIVNMRDNLIDNGVKFKFETKFNDLEKDHNQYKVSLTHNDHTYEESYDDVMLAIGHSARDTYESLYHNPLIKMEPKSFAIGLRIEQSQEVINNIQYHGLKHPELKAASYKLAVSSSNGRGVYTFCMCPGGYVVPSISEAGHLCINGMSEHRRDGKNANSAILVTVTPDDYGSDHPLSGIEYQRKIEAKAFNVSKDYRAPVQLADDYLNYRKSNHLKNIDSTYKPGIVLSDINEILPDYINESLHEGLVKMNKKMPGFIDEDSLLVGVETRSSSPVKILRNKDYHIDNEHIYPIGEGAGMSGGIVSSAIEGIMSAISLLKEDHHED